MKRKVVQIGRGLQRGSPVSDDGRGLKHIKDCGMLMQQAGSPVSDDGRGLKPVYALNGIEQAWVRPSVMTGVD